MIAGAELRETIVYRVAVVVEVFHHYGEGGVVLCIAARCGGLGALYAVVMSCFPAWQSQPPQPYRQPVKKCGKLRHYGIAYANHTLLWFGPRLTDLDEQLKEFSAVWAYTLRRCEKIIHGFLRLPNPAMILGEMGARRW